MSRPSKRPQGRNLRATRYCQPYQARLRAGWSLVLMWASSICLEVQQCLADPETANVQLEKFIQWCYDHSYTFHQAKHALLACQHVNTSLRFRLRDAWESLRSWSLELSLKNRLPMPMLVLEALAITSLLSAFATPLNSADRCKGR